MIIRRERPSEAEAVDALHDRAFSPSTLESRILRGLRADPGVWIPKLSLVLVDGDDLIGHVVASRGHLGAVPVLGVGPVAVTPDRQRQGGGTILMHALAAAADALDEPLLVLLGDPAFYGRLGYVTGSGLGVQPPVAGWGPHFQVRALSTYDPAVHRGTFGYAPAFELTG